MLTIKLIEDNADGARCPYIKGKGNSAGKVALPPPGRHDARSV